MGDSERERVTQDYGINEAHRKLDRDFALPEEVLGKRFPRMRGTKRCVAFRRKRAKNIRECFTMNAI